MEVEEGRWYAVLSGDIVGSSRLSPSKRRALLDAMQGANESLRDAFPDAVPEPLDFFRGDGWQAVVAEPGKALRISLFFRAFLKSELQSHSIDSRVSIALGPLDFVPEGNVSRGEGQAFQLSGKGLDGLPRHVHMMLSAPDRPDPAAASQVDSLDLMIELVDQIAFRWTDKQSLAVLGALRAWKQEKIGRTWGPGPPIKQQTVQQHLDKASWHSIARSVDFFEKSVASLLNALQ